MNVCVIGAGYVGLTTAAVLSDIGHHVTCIDQDIKKIASLQNGYIPIFEPDLEDCVQKNKSRLRFTDDLPSCINHAEIIIMAVGTPSLPDGSTNLSFLYKAMIDVMEHLASYKIIMIKSTVPPGTNAAILQLLKDKGYQRDLFDLVSNPEFLREGSALHDMKFPDRIVYGLAKENEDLLGQMKELYRGIDAPVIVTNYAGAELIKYASNAFLAAKISFINEIARFCEQFGADVTHVAKGIGLDARIGPSFLQAGIGYGGSCFPKDLKSLSFTAKDNGLQPLILDAVQSVNASQMNIYFEKIRAMFQDLSSMKIAVLGIAFKPNTDDIRESPAVAFIKKLHEYGCTVSAYDPKASLPEELRMIVQTETPEDAMLDADLTVVATDWKQFIGLDWKQARIKMKGRSVLDARNCLDPDIIRAADLNYIGVGRI
ncbi:UDP-glucose/GDP-mannose dehydrogenase family protein [Peribacillus frigoritolerans]|nr:UDP-glucose/GDP-mannose dehydrogenase family protein [Peribacillus frigoritolerans]